jgi:hypothetical protein
VIKILYYSVIERRIPKVKFVGGDASGVAVFYTNYVPSIVANCHMELCHCHLYNYKGSVEIVNQKNFSILAPKPPPLNAKLLLTPQLKQELAHWYYPVQDPRCALVRQVAHKLNARRAGFNVYRLVVKVTVEINSAAGFWQVGDSSGRMLAYLPTGRIKEGDLIRLLKVRAMRGSDKTKLFSEEIMFLDCCGEKAIVRPYRFGCIEESDHTVSL